MLKQSKIYVFDEILYRIINISLANFSWSTKNKLTKLAHKISKTIFLNKAENIKINDHLKY